MSSGPLELTDDRPVPEPGPGQLLVKVIACGVCRTDLHLAEGDLPPHHPRLTPGHEVVGQVTATGPGTTRFAVGDRVGAAWLAGTDGSCRFCRRGQENLCPGSSYTGWDIPGGYAEYLTVADAFAHPLPGGFSDTELAPLLCAGHHRLPGPGAGRGAARWHARHLGLRRLGAPGRAGRAGPGRPGARLHPRPGRPRPGPRAGRGVGPGFLRPLAGAAGLGHPVRPGRRHRAGRAGRPGPQRHAGHRGDLPDRHPGAELREAPVPGAATCAASPPTPAATPRSSSPWPSV